MFFGKKKENKIEGGIKGERGIMGEGEIERGEKGIEMGVEGEIEKGIEKGVMGEKVIGDGEVGEVRVILGFRVGKRRHWFAGAVALILVVMAGWGMLRGGKNSAFAGTYTWIQNNWGTTTPSTSGACTTAGGTWAGGACVGLHGTNGSNWTTYDSKDANVTASAGGVSLGQTTGFDTDTLTGDFGGTNTNTTNTSDQIALAKSASITLTQTDSSTTVPSPSTTTGGFRAGYYASNTGVYESGGATHMLKQFGATCGANQECVSSVCSTTCQYPPCSALVSCGDSCTQSGLNYGTVSIGSQCWLDRNLGAARVAMSADDNQAYGWYFQWGRLADGHQISTSGTTGTLSSTDAPGHANFITITGGLLDWRSPQNGNLWGFAAGYINNPCPTNWHVPTIDEWNGVFSTLNLNSCSSNCRVSSANSSLKLVSPGNRISLGAMSFSMHMYWSASISVDGRNSYNIQVADSGLYTIYANGRANGMAVRCLHN
jgi:uncharacterized protein (TIGR02145 family)